MVKYYACVLMISGKNNAEINFLWITGIYGKKEKLGKKTKGWHRQSYLSEAENNTYLEITQLTRTA